MRITIVGPRSVGKSTTAKIVAERLGLDYLSSDNIMDKCVKDHGGLDAVIKAGKDKLIYDRAIPLIKKCFEADNFVLDLAAGAVASTKVPEVCQEVIRIISNNSKVIGLMLSENDEKSINALYEREKKRPHFKEMPDTKLKEQTTKDYIKLKPIMKKICKSIIYSKNKSPEEVAKEIISNL